MALLLNANDSVSRSYSITKPSPLHPIYPSECGERTANLFDKDATLDGYWLSSATGAATRHAGYSVSDYIRISDGESYTLVKAGTTFCWYDENKTFISTTESVTTASAPMGAVYFRVNLYTTNKGIAMAVEGSTAPTSYIPYGYKLPLSSANQNVDIYLGESQTTRRIKKLVLTGKETPASITQTTDGNNYCVAYKYSDLGMTDIKDYDELTYLCPYPVFVSSHFAMKSIEGLPLPNDYNDIQPGQVGGNTWIPMVAGVPTYNRYIIFCVSDITTINDFKSYLAAQYANGTPVTIWYVLATEETGTLNEPLRKIGDYADTIDSTQTTAQIPTSAGSTTISWAGEGLAPSEFDSIQEWVDIPTYTYTNGAWVADN